MRAAYKQLEHMLSHPGDFLMDYTQKNKTQRAKAGIEKAKQVLLLLLLVVLPPLLPLLLLLVLLFMLLLLTSLTQERETLKQMEKQRDAAYELAEEAEPDDPVQYKHAERIEAMEKMISEMRQRVSGVEVELQQSIQVLPGLVNK